jgi:hypothetical protein
MIWYNEGVTDKWVFFIATHIAVSNDTRLSVTSKLATLDAALCFGGGDEQQRDFL